MKSRRWLVALCGLLVLVGGCEAILGIEEGTLRPEAEH